MTALQIIGCTLAGVSIINAFASKGTWLHELAWVIGAVSGAAIAAVGWGVISL
jgi:hypothetical protein